MKSKKEGQAEGKEEQGTLKLLGKGGFGNNGEVPKVFLIRTLRTL